MSNVLYTAMLPEVSPHCSGAPELQITNAIRNACIEFCMRSWCWQVESDPMPVSANVQDYSLAGTYQPATAAIAEILYGYFNGKPIAPITKDDAIKECPNWKTHTGTKPTRFLAGDAMTSVSLIPIPSGNSSTSSQSIVPNGLFFTLALKPTRGSTGFPDFLYERYLEDIAHGAIARMVAIPHKNWSNANLALFHKKEFIDAAATARIESSKSFTRAKLRSSVTGVARW